MKKRCDVCGNRVKFRYVHDGLHVCAKCKPTVKSCDNYKAKTVEKVQPAVSRARYESERLQAAKNEKQQRVL